MHVAKLAELELTTTELTGVIGNSQQATTYSQCKIKEEYIRGGSASQ